MRKITLGERERWKKVAARLGHPWDERSEWTDLSEDQLGEVFRGYSGPFAFHRDLWHRLECTYREPDGPVHKMKCSLEVRGKIELRSLTEDPEPTPRCADCMKVRTGKS